MHPFIPEGNLTAQPQMHEAIRALVQALRDVVTATHHEVSEGGRMAYIGERFAETFAAEIVHMNYARDPLSMDSMLARERTVARILVGHKAGRAAWSLVKVVSMFVDRPRRHSKNMRAD